MATIQHKWSFAELIDLDRVRSMMDDFFLATGFVVGIVDTNGQILVQVGYRDICTQYQS